MATLGGRYRLVERVGAGGMSVVWRAFDEVLGRQVAIKVLAGDFAANPDLRRSIRHEARAVARLAHPNIGVVYDYGEWRDSAGIAAPYVVMELIDGTSLLDRLRVGALPWRAALGVCAQVAAALGAAHARGLVHRDVKPANIMLSGVGVKVVDFGISALVGEQADQDSNGIVLGTPGYVAPERLTGAPVGAAGDVYALGIVLFKTLVGRLPWPVADKAGILCAHLTARPDALPPMVGLPDNVAELYLRCLAKDPRQRPAAAEVAAVLGEAAGLAVAPIDGLVGDVTDPAAGRELTRLLPSATGTRYLAVAGSARVPHGRTGTRPMWRHRRRIGGLALLPLVVLAGGLYLTTTEDHERTQVARAIEAEGPACAVTYHVNTDDGTAFTGTLTLDARQTPPAGGWTLSFDLPSDQTFQAVPPGTSTQNRDHVVVRLAASGATGSPGSPGSPGKIMVPFTGNYRGANSLPAAFVASGHPCTPVLLGPAGATPSVSTSGGTAGAVPPAKPKSPGHGNGSGEKPGKEKGRG